MSTEDSQEVESTAEINGLFSDVTSGSDDEDESADVEKNTPADIDVDNLMSQLEEIVDMEQKRYKGLIAGLWIVALVFLLLWLVGLPLAFAHSEGWTYQASWYFSIQAGFGVGFGALTVRTRGMEIFLIVHLCLGAISIAFLVSYLVSKAIDGAETKKKTKSQMKADQESLGQTVVGYRSWAIGILLLLIVVAGGILYGMLHEKWNFTESLYFIVSSCQTSGLLAPTIRPYDKNQLFAPLIVSLLVIVGVPLWAYAIGKAAIELVHIDRAQKRHTTVLERLQTSQEGFKRLAPILGVDVSSEGDAMIYRDGFLVQWLLYHKFANEEMIQDVVDEFENVLKEDGDCVPQWKIIARVHFLQLAQEGLIDRNNWQAFCDEVRQIQDKNVVLDESKNILSSSEKKKSTAMSVVRKAVSSTRTSAKSMKA